MARNVVRRFLTKSSNNIHYSRNMNNRNITNETWRIIDDPWIKIHVDLWFFMFYGFYIRGFARNSGIHGNHDRCIPGFPGFLEEYLCQVSVHFLHFPSGPENVQKVHGGRPPTSRAAVFVSEVCPRKSRKTSDAKAALEEFLGIPRIPRESVIFGLAALPFLEIRDFEDFRGLEKAGFDLTALLFLKFQLWNFRKVHGVLEFRLFGESRNPFVMDLTLLRYFFRFSFLKIESEFLQNI